MPHCFLYIYFSYMFWSLNYRDINTDTFQTLNWLKTKLLHRSIKWFILGTDLPFLANINHFRILFQLRLDHARKTQISGVRGIYDQYESRFWISACIRLTKRYIITDSPMIIACSLHRHLDVSHLTQAPR